MKKRWLALLLIATIPVYFALLGFRNIQPDASHAALIVHAAVVNIPVMAILGLVTTLILQPRRPMWWAMIVCFVYAYLGLGLIWGGFYQEGLFGSNTVNTAALFAVIGFAASTFVYVMMRMMRRLLDSVKEDPKR